MKLCSTVGTDWTPTRLSSSETHWRSIFCAGARATRAEEETASNRRRRIVGVAVRGLRVR